MENHQKIQIRTLQISMFWKVFSSFVCLLFLTTSFQLLAEEPPYRWENLKIGGGGYVTGIAIHPSNKDIMYIRTDVGGAYRWNATEKKWEQMLGWIDPENANLIGVDGIALDYNNPDRVYLALGQRIEEEGGIFRSDDRGQTWAKLLDMPCEGNGRVARWIGECIAVDPTNSAIIYFGTRRNGLWRSNDDGKTWSEITSVPHGYTGINPSGVRSIVFDPSGKIDGRSATIYAGVPRSGIYFSTDGGKSFAPMTGSPNDPARMQVVDGELFVTHSRGVSFFSDEKWNDISPSPNKNYVGLAVDGTDNQKIIVAQRYRTFFNAIFRTKDKGLTWEEINTNEFPSNLHISIPTWPQDRFSSATAGMALAPGTSGELFYTDWFGVWQSPDIWAKTTDWHTLVDGHEETVVLTLVSPPAGPLLYSGVADVSGYIHENTDRYTDKKIYPLKECFNISVCESQPSHLALLGAKGWGGEQTTFVTSTDYGKTWTKRTLPEKEILGRIAVSSTNPDNMVYVGGSGKVYYSHNRGDSWAAGQNAPDKVIELVNIWKRDKIMAPDPVDGSFYIYKEGFLFASADGVSWQATNKTPIPCPAGKSINIGCVPGRSGEIWICLDSDGLWKSTDAGANFERLSGFDRARLTCWGAPAPGSLIPTSYCYGIYKGKWGMYRSTDLGQSWLRINDDSQQFPAGVMAIDADKNIFGRIYSGSGGYGITYGEPTK
ncbi:MAG: hypothetical protein RBS73_12860 [Prolixibacteraceae bacterium]|jgi:photosystem II stability/assembly factor-like uncharacterized protein|nr:hypothetical protein [Prolixibacteraceae bacterium]